VDFSNVNVSCFEYVPSDDEAIAQSDRNGFKVLFKIK